jgi:4-aminobutyrate aminotransferase-like enzyme
LAGARGTAIKALSQTGPYFMTTNAALLARRNAAVPRALGHATNAYAQRALNSEVWDVEGNR